MAKEIDLIMNPASAPAELKAAVDAHKVSYNKLVKANTKRVDALNEVKTATEEFDKTAQAYNSALQKWEVK